MIKKLLCIFSLLLFFKSYSQTIIYSEDFNDESTWADWTVEDRDGDGEFWEFADAEYQEVESFTGGFVWSFSWFFETFTPDNLLISPAIGLPEEVELSLSFKVAAFEDDETFQEHYAVYVIPADSTFMGTEEPVFEETLDADYYNPPKTVNVDISSFAGQEVKLVFRHYESTDIFYISMDDILIEQGILGTTDFEKRSVTIFPNPTSDKIQIDGLMNVDKIRIFNLQGQMVKEVMGEEADIKELQMGTYIVNFYTESEVFSRKILKK